MWMSDTENISFLWLDGYTYNLKDMRVYPSYDKFIKIPLKQTDKLDEIASRGEIFGSDAESYSYLLFEANVEKITENDFDLNKLHELRVPIIT